MTQSKQKTKPQQCEFSNVRNKGMSVHADLAPSLRSEVCVYLVGRCLAEVFDSRGVALLSRALIFRGSNFYLALAEK